MYLDIFSCVKEMKQTYMRLYLRGIRELKTAWQEDEAHGLGLILLREIKGDNGVKALA